MCSQSIIRADSVLKSAYQPVFGRKTGIVSMCESSTKTPLSAALTMVDDDVWPADSCVDYAHGNQTHLFQKDCP